MASEGKNIWCKLHDGGKKLSDDQRWRRGINWLATILGFAVVIGLIFKFRPPSLFAESSLGELFSRVALLCSMILLAIPSLVLPKKHHLRMGAAALLFVAGSVTAAVLSVMVHLSLAFLEKEVDFNITEAFSVFVLANGSAMTAAVFWDLPEITESGLHIAHVHALEVSAYSVAPAAVVGFTIRTVQRRAQREVLFVVLPQVAAHVIPLLLSYLASLFKSSNDLGAEVSEETISSSLSDDEPIRVAEKVVSLNSDSFVKEESEA